MIEKKSRINNTRYRKFLDVGEIDLFSEKDILDKLENIKGKHIREGRSLVIALYYTGGRPCEVLSLVSKKIDKKNSYITIEMPAAKRGLTRKIYLQSSKPLVKEFFEYAKSIFPDSYLFPSFRNKYMQKHTNKKGEIVYYETISAKVRYWFKKWGFDITPYFLRHNRFSRFADNGATENEMRLAKGCKSADSIIPYVHLSTLAAQKLAKKNN